MVRRSGRWTPLYLCYWLLVLPIWWSGTMRPSIRDPHQAWVSFVPCDTLVCYAPPSPRSSLCWGLYLWGFYSTPWTGQSEWVMVYVRWGSGDAVTRGLGFPQQSSNPQWVHKQYATHRHIILGLRGVRVHLYKLDVRCSAPRNFWNGHWQHWLDFWGQRWSLTIQQTAVCCTVEGSKDVPPPTFSMGLQSPQWSVSAGILLPSISAAGFLPIGSPTLFPQVSTQAMTCNFNLLSEEIWHPTPLLSLTGKNKKQKQPLLTF